MAYHYDRYVRDHEDFLKQAKEEIAFMSKHGEKVFNQIKKETRTKIEYQIEKRQEEREYIFKPEDKYFKRPYDEEEKKKFQEPLPEIEYEIKHYYETDFKKLQNYSKLFVPKEEKEEQTEQQQIMQEQKEQIVLKITEKQKKEYATMIIKRNKALKWKHFWADPVIEQLAQYYFALDQEMFMTRVIAYLPTFSVPNYHQQYISKYNKAIPRNLYYHKYHKLTIFRSGIKTRELGWPYRPRLDIPFPRIVKDYDHNCKFIMYNRRKELTDYYYKFGKITWNRFYVEARYPWTLLNAFAMGLAAIKNWFLIHNKFG